MIFFSNANNNKKNVFSVRKSVDVDFDMKKNTLARTCNKITKEKKLYNKGKKLNENLSIFHEEYALNVK